MQMHDHAIAVCSWSLRPTEMQDLITKVRQLGLDHVQLALADLLGLDHRQREEELSLLRASGIAVTGGMLNFDGEDYATIERIRKTGGFIPNEFWPQRKHLSIEGARLAREMGINTLTTHVGFVPPPSESGYPLAVQRIREIAEAIGEFGCDLLMETGQESATEMLEFLHDLDAANVHINFDPANMILYGAGDPIAAVATLAEHIRHVHVKDGTSSSKPGKEWGTEVPFGAGEVGPKQFVTALNQIGYRGPLALEREAGDHRLADVAAGIAALREAF